MRNAIERAILSTLLYRDLSLEADFDKLVEYKIDFELFKSNTTCKAVAKAIFNQKDKPYDAELILAYMSKRMDLNSIEWFEITTTSGLCYDLMIRYVDELKEMEEIENMKRLRNGN